ncbi:FkbM family methyltransferase [Henriciella sp. AS95]|uniref:FkbM family methyltransferase n=1 Tax=Henriciella sp. AS95 TaxID=3135782 RepID=UPI003175CCE6
MEFGALNGRDFSNTYLLEKIGWNGIVAEPHPHYSELVPANRNCHISKLCVFDVSNRTVNFRMVTGRPALSGIGKTQLSDNKRDLRNKYRTVKIQTISLNDLLEKYAAPKVIDFISVDTEGSEYKILKKFDYDRWQVRCFCVEHNHTQRKKITRLMSKHGYVSLFPEMSGHDDWWVRSEEVANLQAVSLDASEYSDEVFEKTLHARFRTLRRYRRRLLPD